MSEDKDYQLFSERNHLKMSWIRCEIQLKSGNNVNYPPPLPPPPSDAFSGGFHRESTHSSSSSVRISPAVLFVIVILAVLFFISGLLHLLFRFLVKQPSSASSQSNRYPEISSSDALQRQLQQLFHLHDSGLDQAFIDALPVFQYKEIVGLKEPFDCAVCLGTLFNSEFSLENPIFDFDDLRDEDGCPGNGETRCPPRPKTVEIEEIVVEKGAMLLPVRLGKFRRLNEEKGDAEGGETSSSNLDARRCFSMGSYQYVLGNVDLIVPDQIYYAC